LFVRWAMFLALCALRTELYYVEGNHVVDAQTACRRDIATVRRYLPNRVFKPVLVGHN
jgi:hypothetical protein